MDSAEYERKIAHRFAAFDQDGNGYIDRADFNAAAARLLTEFGTKARCDRGQSLYSGAEAFWQGMAGIADVDGDQRVNRQEFVGGAVKRLRDNPERFAEIARPFLRAALAVAAGTDPEGTAPASAPVARWSGPCGCWAPPTTSRAWRPGAWTPTRTAGSRSRTRWPPSPRTSP